MLAVRCGRRWKTALLAGGYLGFTCGHVYMDDLTIEGWDTATSTWKTQMVERFTVNASGYAEHRPAYDAAGNPFGSASKRCRFPTGPAHKRTLAVAAKRL